MCTTQVYRTLTTKRMSELATHDYDRDVGAVSYARRKADVYGI